MDYKLTRCQQAGLDSLLESRENIFITGGPGTGKSYLINEFLNLESHKIPVVASTGAAAILVGGRTFHSFFNLGIMQGSVEQVIDRALQNPRLIRRLNDVNAVVVDEVSMLSWQTLDCAEKIARAARKFDAPWGGMRMIVVGDFAQLPPISRGMDREKEKTGRDWCFLGEAWAGARFKTISLQEVKRTDDVEFLQVLEEIRWGKRTDRVEDFLNSRVIEPHEVEVDTPHVFPRRAQTEAFNKAKLADLPNPLRIFETEYDGDKRYIERLKTDAPIPPVLELKKGALVMLRVNDSKRRYVNGSLGIISHIEEEVLQVEAEGQILDIEPYYFVMLDADGDEVAYAKNFPLTLAYANTIHKMQGTTLDRIHVSLRALWEPGQAYVALSRARSGAGVTLAGWDASSIKADPQVREFYQGQAALAQ